DYRIRGPARPRARRPAPPLLRPDPAGPECTRSRKRPPGRPRPRHPGQAPHDAKEDRSMRTPHDRPGAITLRLYRRLARAFPHEFQTAWGDDLIEVREDTIESIWRRHGLPGLLRLLADIALRIPVEYAAELGQDVRFGRRTLAASPGFTAV